MPCLLFAEKHGASRYPGCQRGESMVPCVSFGTQLFSVLSSLNKLKGFRLLCIYVSANLLERLDGNHYPSLLF